MRRFHAGVVILLAAAGVALALNGVGKPAPDGTAVEIRP